MPTNASENRTSPKPKQEVVFLLNESLSRSVKQTAGERKVEETVPTEHKFVMAPLGSQDVYILKQSEENSKGM
jgi:hypothetical protein